MYSKRDGNSKIIHNSITPQEMSKQWRHTAGNIDIKQETTFTILTI